MMSYHVVSQEPGEPFSSSNSSPGEKPCISVLFHEHLASNRRIPLVGNKTHLTHLFWGTSLKIKGHCLFPIYDKIFSFEGQEISQFHVVCDKRFQ